MKKKLRHRLVYKLAAPIIYKFLKRKFNFTYESCNIKPPFIVLANHTTDYDAFFISASFKDNIYFVMSDHVSSLKSGKLINYLVSPIPITKSGTDAETVKNIFSILKQNGAVGIFPEGNKSFSGGPSWIKPSTAKLVRKAKVPIILYNITGGYFSSPRWSKVKRKGHIHGFVRKILTPEDIINLTDDELYNLICSNLNINAYIEQEKHLVEYRANNKADNIQALLYYCPCCGGFNTIYGLGEQIKCKTCNLNANINQYGYLENSPFERLDIWDEWQKKKLLSQDFESLKDNDIITSDKDWCLQLKQTKYKSMNLGKFTSVITKKYLMFKNNIDEIKINVSDIIGMAIEGICSIQLSLKNGTVYRLKNDLNTNGLKYVNLINRLNGTPYKF